MAQMTHIKTTLRRELDALLNGAPDLAGFALRTDDNVCSLFHVVLTDDHDDDDDIVFGVYDWPDVLADRGFEETNFLLGEQLDALDDDEARDREAEVFGLFVEALADAKGRHSCLSDAFLEVSSTDPSDEMELHQEQAIARLNPEDVSLAWEAWTAQW
ncbi:MAG: hypothetical protein ACR2P0_10595 [Acidimicrobiales bacterium]